MGVFDSFADTPGQLKTEGEQIILKFLPGVPVSGQGTLQWNIPPPAQGCSATDGIGRYCGILLLASTQPLDQSNIPSDGTVYDSDPTVDTNKHVGDKIGNALVVGAFYEGEKRARGEILTTSLVVNDIQAKAGYYFGAYAVDCQNRYHSDGVRAYSMNLGATDEVNLPSKQIVQLGDETAPCVLSTDGTGLIPGVTYKFEIIVDDNFPTSDNVKNIIIDINGDHAETYGELVEVINEQIAKKYYNSVLSPEPPKTGTYYWNSEKVQQWDGTQFVEIPAIIQATDPAIVANGSYWFNPDTETLYVRSGSAWNIVQTTRLDVDPTTAFKKEVIWFTGTQAFVRCGSTWCERPLHSTTIDPSLSEQQFCSYYWFDETNEKLLSWDEKTHSWVQVNALSWDVDPLNLAVDTYWLNYATRTLYQLDVGGAWQERDYVCSTVAPGPPRVPGMLWYNPETEQLFVRNSINTAWNEVSVIVWPFDPRDVESCDLWWNTSNDTLNKWDIVHSEWDSVESFVQSPTDPTIKPQLEVNEFWFNPDTNELMVWDGVVWLCPEYILSANDPSIPSNGDAWYNTETKVFNVWETDHWVEIQPVYSNQDPSIFAQGTIWFDTAINVLYVRIGIGWVPVPYVTTFAYPRKTDTWYNITTKQLMQWNGTAWIEIQPGVSVNINKECDLEFVSQATGSKAVVIIPVPYDLPTNSGGCKAYLSADMSESVAFCQYYGKSRAERKYSAEYFPPNEFLFANLVPTAIVLETMQGEDGVSGTPSYDRIGVGDDGTPDERRKLAEIIRQQLGYPVVDVELTISQIDQAIQNALETFRQQSSLAYKRAAIFLDLEPYKQHYKLTSESMGMHKIVNVMSIYRFTSSFLSSAHGAGVYGQIVLQHLYNMGTFDLLSYHIVSDYVEQLEMLFATRPTFHWDEPSRTLTLYQSYVRPERVLLDVSIERTEQEIFMDRWSKRWIQRYALAEAMDVLAQIRGKYSTLPGAGGGVTLNAADLTAKADKLREELQKELDDLIAQDIEDYGIGGVLTIG